MQPERLVQLKIKCRYRHFLPFFDINCNLGPASNALRTQPNRFNQTTYAAHCFYNPLRQKNAKNLAPVGTLLKWGNSKKRICLGDKKRFTRQRPVAG
jgi:hypothetical protein